MTPGKRTASWSVEEAERALEGPVEVLHPLMLAAGGEGLLRERLVQACRRGAEREGSEFQRLEGDALDAETLASALATISLFGGGRRIWIREGAKMAAAVEEALLAWAEAPSEGAFVLMTTSREPDELKFVATLAARATFVSCAVQGREAVLWAERIAREEGLKLPSQTAEAIEHAAPDLLSYRQEIRKLAVHADPEGRVPARALDVLREARLGASVERWAQAVLSGTAAAARAETLALAREGVGGTAALWALAERALGALEPQTFGYRRASSGPPLGVAKARAVLDAVYRADRALKRGEIKDVELADTLVHTVRQAIRG